MLEDNFEDSHDGNRYTYGCNHTVPILACFILCSQQTVIIALKNIKRFSLIHTMFSVTYELKFYVIRHLSNYTNQVHDIYSNLQFLLHVSLLHHHQGEIICLLIKRTFCYGTIVYGYCNSYFVNCKR